MSEYPTEISTGVKRRSVLKSVGAVGFGPLARVVDADDNKREITIVENRDGPFVTKFVDAEWYQHEKHVDGVAMDARKELLPMDGVRAVGIGAGLTRVGGRPAGHLRVYVDKHADEVRLPDTYQGLPIERVERGESMSFCDCNNTEYDYIPGGVKIATSSSIGSAACKVELDGSYYLLTCQHLFSCSPSSDVDFMQGPNNTKFGYVDVDASSPSHFDSTEDWALITLSSGGSADGYDNYIEDYAGKLSGHVTKSGLTDFLCSNSEPKTVYKQSYKTCKDQGCIVDRDKSTGNADCSGTTSGFVEANVHVEHGDSGGIIFKQYTYNGCLYTAPIGVISSGPDNSSNNCTAAHKGASDDIDCMSAYKLNNDYGINFDPNFSLGC